MAREDWDLGSGAHWGWLSWVADHQVSGVPFGAVLSLVDTWQCLGPFLVLRAGEELLLVFSR